MSEIKNKLVSFSPIDLIIHVGAHLGQELDFYESLNPKKVLWIEADPDLFLRLKNNLNNSINNIHITHLALVSSELNKELILKRYSNDGASNSVYHQTENFNFIWPSIYEIQEEITIKSQTLKSIIEYYNININDFSNSLLVLDVQGHELDVLLGAEELIECFNYICTEISLIPIYKGGCSGEDVIEFLNKHNFITITQLPQNPSKHDDVLLKRKMVI